MRFVTGQNAALHSRSQAGIKRQLPTGYPPFIPFALLNYVTVSERSSCNFFFEKGVFSFTIAGFKLARRLITKRAMQTPIVVINFDVFEDLAASQRLGAKELARWKTFRFQRAEERFSLRIIIAVSLRTHAQIISDHAQGFAYGLTTVLAASIRMEVQPRIGRPHHERAVQRGLYQFCFQCFT